MKKTILFIIIVLIAGLVTADDIQRVRDWRTNPVATPTPIDWRFNYDYGQQPQESYILRPAGNGYYSGNWTDFPDSTYNYQAIREAVANGDASYLYSSTVASKETWVTNLCPDIIVDSVGYYLNMRKNGVGSASVKAGIWKVGTGWVGLDTINLSSTYTETRISYPVDPVDGLQWTASDLNSSMLTRCWGIENLTVGAAGYDTIGLVTQENTTLQSLNYVTLIRFLCDFTGVIDSIGLQTYSNTAGYARFAIYNGVWNNPTTIIDSTLAINCNWTGWHYAPLVRADGVPDTLKSGQYYYLAFMNATNIPVYYKKDQGVGVHRYKARNWKWAWMNPDSTSTSNANAFGIVGLAHIGVGENRITQSYLQVYYHSGGTVPMVQKIYKPPIQAMFSKTPKYIYR